ncbi:MAG: hypothetical protein HC927_08405 [Deltaproteobacteria bacterium]|nr:hypothetical protein [Deltaproteobacteria bacterium]
MTDRVKGASMMRLLCETLPQCVPAKAGGHEPLRTGFDPSNIEASLGDWRISFLWKTRKPHSAGSIWMVDPPPELVNHVANLRHSKIIFRVEDFRALDVRAVISVAVDWAKVSNADIGFVHLFTDPDAVRGIKNGGFILGNRKGRDNSVMWSTPRLKEYIPDLYWLMVFGPPYIDLFTRDRLLSAPAHEVRELDSGHITIQLTESYLDLETDYPRVAAVRDRVIEHLGPDAFFAEGRTEYRTPKFTFPR